MICDMIVRRIKIWPKSNWGKRAVFSSRIKNPHLKAFSTNSVSKLIQEEELTVPTFCNIIIKVLFSVKVKPLDIHRYENCNKILIKLQGEENCGRINLSQNENTICIFSEAKNLENNAICHIEAPIKANLDIESNANIFVGGYFNGEHVNLKTEGNITVDKYQGNKINICTTNGNIHLKETIQAATIGARILEKGSISTNKLQGLTANLQTKQGNISVKSSYCNSSNFFVETGDLRLDNIHRDCQISIKNSGNLSLVGFDGKLVANLNNSNADIHISQIHSNSQINMGNGKLILRSSENCHKLTRILAKQLINENNIALNSDNDYYLTVTCKNGIVVLEEQSWADMLARKFSE